MAFLAGGLALASGALASARPFRGAGSGPFEPEAPLFDQAPPPGEPAPDRARRAAPPSRGDTIDFGFYEVRQDGLKYAVRGGKWTFDHGAADPLEGFTSDDLTTNDRSFWRHVTEAIWTAEGNPSPWPQMNASPGIALCGATQGYADSLSWAAGLGYGNLWCQRLISPSLVYDGSGGVHLSFQYFNETEAGYDYSKLFVAVGSTRALLNAPGFHGPIGVDGAGTIAPPLYDRSVTHAELGGGGADPREFRLVLEVESDGVASDEDGYEGFDAFYGAIGLDDVVVDGANLDPPITQTYAFDNDLSGWTAEICPGVGSFLGVAPLSQYLILDPGCCPLRGNVLEMHDDTFRHPDGQHELAISPIVDRVSDIGDPEYLEYNRILADWDMYGELPMEAGVFWRARWSYFPYENPYVPGLVTWSPTVGSPAYYYLGADPVCASFRDIGTDWGIPPTSQKVKFVFELLADCDFLGVPCTQETNFSPILDNLRVRNVELPLAPPIQFAPGGRFQDGFGQAGDGLLSPYDRGDANIVFNLRLGSQNPAKLGDSLAIIGPMPSPNGSTRWEARLWFRVARTGAAQDQIHDYLRWRRALAVKGIDFWTGPRPQFTWGYMDSIEVGTQVAKHKFCSQFRDGPSSGGGGLPADVCFNWGGGGEQEEGNEMLPDQIFSPGTKIEYFATSNYVCLPGEYYHLPDTTGGYFEEFEILPSYRWDGGLPKFPCILYVNAYRPDRESVLPHGLNVALNDAGVFDPIPPFAPWDQYDYLDASSSWCAAIYREVGGNAGATLPQLLGYRAILFSTGRYGAGATTTRDWTGFRDWLESSDCGGNLQTQGFLADGTDVAAIIAYRSPDFLSTILGGEQICTDYSHPDCPLEDPDNDTNFCVRLEAATGGPVASAVPLDLFGNWCPVHADFDVLDAVAGGVGGKDYEKIGTGTRTSYAQVVHDRSGGEHKYRTVLNGFSSFYLTTRDPEAAPDPDLECPADFASRVGAVAAEWGGYLQWMLNVPNPSSIGLCVAHPDCAGSLEGVPTEAPGTALVNRLDPNRPNPFNPRTTIRYSLAAEGKATLVVYDVSGRMVRTLVDGPRAAGPHEVMWDGTDDAGRAMPSGVYWCRLSTAGYASNRRLIVLK